MQLISPRHPPTDWPNEQGHTVFWSMGLQTADNKYLNLKSSYFTQPILELKVLTGNVTCVHVLERLSIECRFLTVNYCTVGFEIGWGVSSLIGKWLVWLWFHDTQLNTTLIPVKPKQWFLTLRSKGSSLWSCILPQLQAQTLVIRLEWGLHGMTPNSLDSSETGSEGSSPSAGTRWYWGVKRGDYDNIRLSKPRLSFKISDLWKQRSSQSIGRSDLQNKRKKGKRTVHRVFFPDFNL